MKAYGSLMNRVQEEMRSAVPELGMGVTEMCYSDRHAYTVAKVLTDKRILVQRDKATRVDDRGMSECQTWEYEADPDAPALELRLNKRGSWMMVGSPQGNTFMVGMRDEYYDFSF